MNDSDPSWTATISVRCGDPHLVDWVSQSLRPEAAREVPRTHATLSSERSDAVVIEISARDAGALRAALNTYLGWVELSLATARAAGVASDSSVSRA